MPETPNPKIRSVPSPPPIPPPSTCAYAELDVTTNFSFLRGASHPDELVFRAAELGYRAVAVTDHNSLAGVVRAHEAAKQTGLKLIVGARLSLADAPDVLAWVTDRAAYARLCRLLTLGKRRAKKGECDLHLNDLLERSDGLLLGVTPPGAATGNDDWTDALRRLREAAAGRVWLAVSSLYGAGDRRRLDGYARLARVARV